MGSNRGGISGLWHCCISDPWPSALLLSSLGPILFSFWSSPGDLSMWESGVPCLFRTLFPRWRLYKRFFVRSTICFTRAIFALIFFFFFSSLHNRKELLKRFFFFLWPNLWPKWIGLSTTDQTGEGKKGMGKRKEITNVIDLGSHDISFY